MKSHYDVVIVGGGAMGCAAAYFLTRESGFDGSVCVIERDPGYTRASSALSASGMRQQFSTALNIRMSQFSVGFLKDAEHHLGVDDEPVDIGLHERGYLILATERGAAQLKENHALQISLGADISLLDPAACVERFGFLSPNNIAIASYGERDEGWFDGYAVLQAFRKKARAQGAEMIAGEVAGLGLKGNRIKSVRLSDGQEIAAGIVVNACGPWAGTLAAMAGIDLPVRARKRQVFVFDCRDEVKDLPMVFDPSGLWVRPEGQFFICGKAPDAGDDPDGLPLEVDYSQFDRDIWPLLAQRIPAFEAIKMTNAWAGYYEVNTFDSNAIIGPHPVVENFIFINGFSGHGIMHTPAAGRGVAEWIETGGYPSLDLSPYSFERIARQEPIRELTVY